MFIIQCDYEKETNIMVCVKDERKCLIMNIACVGDQRVIEKDEEKHENNDSLKYEVYNLLLTMRMEIIAIVISDVVTKRNELTNWRQKIGGSMSRLDTLQKTVHVGITCHL